MKRYLKHLVLALLALGYLVLWDHRDWEGYAALACAGVACLLEWVLVQVERKHAQVVARRRSEWAE